MINSTEKKNREKKETNKEVQFSSIAQLCPTLCSPMDCSSPVSPVRPQLLKPTQTHIHWVVMPSNNLILYVPFSSCLNRFQNQGLFQWVSSSHQVAKGLEFQPQHQPSTHSQAITSFQVDAASSLASGSHPNLTPVWLLVLSYIWIICTLIVRALLI